MLNKPKPAKEVDDLIPKSGFIRHYVEYASRCTDAPILYHVGCAAAIVSVVIADRIHLFNTDSSGTTSTKTPLNIWLLVTGRSSLDRKSTSVNLAKNILRESFPNRMAPLSGSMEGIIEFLVEQPCSIFVAPELAALLDQMEASYWRQGRTLLMDLYDAPETYTRKLRNQEAITIQSPRISVLGASALTLLEKASRDVDWSGGFLSRFLVIYAERERFQPAKRVNEVTERDLANSLSSLADLDRTRVEITQGAQRLYADFARHLDRVAQRSPEHLHGLICRLADHVQKLAGIYAVTTDSDLGGRCMSQAIAFGKECLETIYIINDKISRDPGMKLRGRVLNLLTKHPEGVYVRDILRRLTILKKQLEPILETLLAEEKIRTEFVGGRKKQLVILREHLDGTLRDGESDDDDVN